MSFLAIETLYHLIWVLPLMAVVFTYAIIKRRKLLALISDIRRGGTELFSNLSMTARVLRFAILAAALSLGILAAARPSWGSRILPFTGKGRDIMIVFDVSKSMLSDDIKPSRLEHAKWLAKQIINDSPGDRFGITAFAGTAFLECPLTSDKASLFVSINELNPDSIPIGGTNLEDALKSASDAFRAAEGAHKAILLISDGDELDGDVKSVISQLKDRKIPLFVAGIGDPSKPSVVMLKDTKGNTVPLRDSKGEAVKSALNEKLLSGLAMDTNGIYVRSTTINPGLEQLDAKIKDLVPHELQSGKQTRPIERYAFPLGAAVILLLIWMAISERRRDPSKNSLSAKTLLALMLPALLFSGSYNADAQEKELPKAPAAAVTDAKQEKATPASDKASPEAIYNSALEKQKSGKEADNAFKLYETAVNVAQDKKEVRNNSFQNMGVIIHEKAREKLAGARKTAQTASPDEAIKQVDTASKELDKAEEMYREAMKEKSDDIAQNQQILLADRAKAEELKKLLEELKKQQQQAQQKTQEAKDQQNKENKQNQQNKDQNKNDQQNKQDQNKQNQQNKDQNKNDQQNKQDQNKQNQQNQQDKNDQQNQQNSQQKTADAADAAKQMKDSAEKLGNKQMEQTASKAENEIKKAQDAQKENKGKEAEKHLDNALKELGANQEQDKDKEKQSNDKKDNKNNGKDDKQNQQDKQDKDKQDQNQQNKQDKPLEKPQAQARQQAQQEEKDINKDQAEALLEMMGKDEKSLRDAIKERKKEIYGTQKPEKDWEEKGPGSI